MPKVASALFALTLAISAPARGDESICPPHGVVRTRVESSGEGSLTRRVLDQVFSELAKRTTNCPPTTAVPLELTIRWREDGHVLVAFEAQTAKRLLSIERDVDLARVPRDGLPLAVAIVADELYGELLEHLTLDLPVTVPRRVTKRTPPPVRSADVRGSWRLGLRLTHQQLTSGLGLTGIDVEGGWRVTPNFDLAIRAGPRAVSFVSDAPGHGYDAAFVASVTTDSRAVRGVGLCGAFDVLGVGPIAAAAPSLGVSAWQRVDRRFLVTFDVRGGVVLRADAENSGVAGAIISASFGFATEW